MASPKYTVAEILVGRGGAAAPHLQYIKDYEGLRELGFAFFGFIALGVGFNHWKKDKKLWKWEWDFAWSSLLAVSTPIHHVCMAQWFVVHGMTSLNNLE